MIGTCYVASWVVVIRLPGGLTNAIGGCYDVIGAVGCIVCGCYGCLVACVKRWLFAVLSSGSAYKLQCHITPHTPSTWAPNRWAIPHDADKDAIGTIFSQQNHNVGVAGVAEHSLETVPMLDSKTNGVVRATTVGQQDQGFTTHHSGGEWGQFHHVFCVDVGRCLISSHIQSLKIPSPLCYGGDSHNVGKGFIYTMRKVHFYGVINISITQLSKCPNPRATCRVYQNT